MEGKKGPKRLQDIQTKAGRQLAGCGPSTSEQSSASSPVPLPSTEVTSHQGCSIPAVCPGSQRGGLAHPSSAESLAAFQCLRLFFLTGWGGQWVLATTCYTTQAVQEELGQADAVTRPVGVAVLGINYCTNTGSAWRTSSFQLPVPITSTHT